MKKVRKAAWGRPKSFQGISMAAARSLSESPIKVRILFPAGQPYADDFILFSFFILIFAAH